MQLSNHSISKCIRSFKKLAVIFKHTKSVYIGGIICLLGESYRVLTQKPSEPGNSVNLDCDFNIYFRASDSSEDIS